MHYRLQMIKNIISFILIVLIGEVVSKICHDPFNGVYYCPHYQVCCRGGCCTAPFTFFNLWWFWFFLLILLILCSGGGYWYKRRGYPPGTTGTSGWPNAFYGIRSREPVNTMGGFNRPPYPGETLFGYRPASGNYYGGPWQPNVANNQQYPKPSGAYYQPEQNAFLYSQNAPPPSYQDIFREGHPNVNANSTTNLPYPNPSVAIPLPYNPTITTSNNTDEITIPVINRNTNKIQTQ